MKQKYTKARKANRPNYWPAYQVVTIFGLPVRMRRENGRLAYDSALYDAKHPEMQKVGKGPAGIVNRPRGRESRRAETLCTASE